MNNEALEDLKWLREHPEDPLDSPEEYLWVRHGDHLSVITPCRLRQLASGVDQPSGQVEEMLAKNPSWIRC